MTGEGIRRVGAARAELKRYMRENAGFAETHTPWPPDQSAPAGVRSMITAAAAAGTGPMAAVAGMIARTCLEGVLAEGNREAIVDNGGDIALKIVEPVIVGLYAGRGFPPHLGFYIEPRESILGICTSAGTVGHSFSYGAADAAVVFSEDVVLADAAATALGNRISCSDDLHHCFDALKEVQGIEGAVAVMQGKIGLWGTVPEIVTATYDPDLITRGRLVRGTENINDKE